MTAPARNGPSTARRGKGQGERKQPAEGTRTRAKPRGRARSTAAERAYARRNERAGTERRARQPQRAAARSSRSQSRQESAQQPVAQKARRLPSKVTSSRLPFVVTVMVVLTAGIVSTLWLSSAAVSNSYELRRAQTEVNALNEQKETLLRQVSIMNSAPALQRRAKELGLVRPPDPAHLVVHPDGSIGVVGEPAPAKAPPPPPVTPPKPPSPGPAPDAGPQGQEAPVPPARQR